LRYPAVDPRPPALWLLALAIPFWFTVWAANAALLGRPRPARVVRVERCSRVPSTIQPIPIRWRAMRYQLGDYPIRSRGHWIASLPPPRVELPVE
jgi:hypothetical protein